MVETAAILNQATERSLIILDEIGRGTATFDGLSIAFACVEHLNAVNRSRTLFATHFHELTQLSQTFPRLFNLTMRVSEWKGALVFLHEVIPGAADRSYGIQVAKLAGLPAAVIKRARAVLSELETARRAGGALSTLDALPLFSYEAPAPPGPDPLREALEKIDADELTPRDAQAALYELKRLAREKPP
jgi:DNA mismatch repair protein MutS